MVRCVNDKSGGWREAGGWRIGLRKSIWGLGRVSGYRQSQRCALRFLRCERSQRRMMYGHCRLLARSRRSFACGPKPWTLPTRDWCTKLREIGNGLVLEDSIDSSVGVRASSLIACDRQAMINSSCTGEEVVRVLRGRERRAHNGALQRAMDEGKSISICPQQRTLPVPSQPASHRRPSQHPPN